MSKYAHVNPAINGHSRDLLSEAVMGRVSASEGNLCSLQNSLINQAQHRPPPPSKNPDVSAFLLTLSALLCNYMHVFLFESIPSRGMLFFFFLLFIIYYHGAGSGSLL